MFRNHYGSLFIPVVLLGLLSLIASYPMLPEGWFNSHEGIAPIERILALSYEIKNGDYYPRWLSSAYLSQGLPFFNFYAPAFYLLTAYLYCLGLPLLFALKLVTCLLFFSGSIGMLLWVKKHCGMAGGIISAVIYLFLPYHFLDIYVRGAMAEFSALAILPFLFYGIDLSFSERAFRGILITGISSAMLILTHNLSAFMIFPFAIGYFFCIVVFERSSRRAVAAFAGPCIGLGLSSFYWLPVILEKEYLGNFAALTSGYFNYANHFVSPSQWVSTYWGFGVSVPGKEDTMGFQIGFPLLVFLVLSVVCLAISKEMRKFGVITLVLGMFGLFMTILPASSIYEIFSQLQYVQFPWRFLGPATMFLSAFSGVAAGLCNKFKILKTVYLILLSLLLSVFLSGKQMSISGRLQIIDITNENIFKGRLIGQLSTVNEYLPKWAEGDISPSLLPQAVQNSTRIEEIEIKGSEASFMVSGETASGIKIPQFFFPGWRAKIDGIDMAITPGEKGFLYFEVPSGTHSVEVWFGTTPPRLVGWALSIFTVLVLVVIRMKDASKNNFPPSISPKQSV